MPTTQRHYKEFNERTLNELVDLRTEAWPDVQATCHYEDGAWKSTSWADLGEQIQSFALGLRKMGLPKDQAVCIIADTCRDWMITDLGVISAGGVTVGVYTTITAQQTQYIIDHSEARIVVVQNRTLLNKLQEVRDELDRVETVIVMDTDGVDMTRDSLLPWQDVLRMGREADADSRESLLQEHRAEKEDRVVTYIYTSGTTGPPKGAMLTHRNLLSLAEAFSETAHFFPEDEVVSYLPLCHIAERLMSVILALYAGYTVNFAESLETIQENLYEIAPTIFVGVPRIWEKMHSSIQIRMKDASWFKRRAYSFWMPIGRKMVEKSLQSGRDSLGQRVLYGLGYFCLYRYILDKMGLLQVRLAISGSAPISPEILKFYKALGLEISEVYGQTEGSGVSHIHHGNDRKIGSVGRPLPGVEFKLAEDGEILFRGNTLFKGYYRDPKATKAALGDGWMRTGDVGVLDEEGYLYITDRKKDIIITAGGKNIAPSEMENRLKCSPYVNQAIVVGDAKPYLSAIIQIELDTVSKWAMDHKIAYTTFKSLAENPEIYDLIRKEVDEANKEFARVESIKKFVLLDKELDHDDDELTATMKVRRKSVEKKFKDLIHTMYRR